MRALDQVNRVPCAVGVPELRVRKQTAKFSDWSRVALLVPDDKTSSAHSKAENSQKTPASSSESPALTCR